MGFPKDFIWGAAAASYQIEGAAYEDGKGLSIWDMLCRKADAINPPDTGDVACDHYHRYKHDVSLMKQIGLKAYRLSISWPRVIPAGTGSTNEKGLAFYDKLTDELLNNGIEPYITLFHWDYPYELYCRGGWLNPDSSDWFADYTAVLVDRLSDRVKNWFTHNEPQSFIEEGHRLGLHAPALKLDWPDVLRAGHNVLLAHGKAVQVIRTRAKTEQMVGYVPVGVISFPATQQTDDVEAARTATFSISEKTLWNNTWWLDPVFWGRYPEDGLKVFGDAMPKFSASDMKTICQPLDFFAVNIYNGKAVCAGEKGVPQEVSASKGHPQTAVNWLVAPEAVYWGPKFLYERYKKPIILTENGMANTDWVALDGNVHDLQRIDFLRRYLLQYRKAADDGVEIKGYFQWSIMDNFEWLFGRSKRFGLIYVEYDTQQRILKDSAYWYKRVIATNGQALDDD